MSAYTVKLACFLWLIFAAGNLLKYVCNGLNAWIVTHSLMVPCSMVGLVNPTLFVDRRGELFLLATAYGALLALFAFFKVPLTRASDCFSISISFSFSSSFGRFFCVSQLCYVVFILCLNFRL